MNSKQKKELTRLNKEIAILRAKAINRQLLLVYQEKNMRKSEIIVGLDSLRYDLEQWKLEKSNSDYYDEVLAEALVILVDIDE